MTPLPKPPKHVKMRKGDLPFWDAIIKARALSEWNDANLIIGAQLARCQYDIERESEALELEGSVVKNRLGTPIPNPRQLILEKLSNREMSLMRSLRLGGSLYPGDKRRISTTRNLEAQARAAHEQVSTEDSDGLLA